uniref:Hexosaminidase D n=1 Tax=Cacopsylla melanoneura TaxID=428564 RepID=A0A8D8QT56_9HEMI
MNSLCLTCIIQDIKSIYQGSVFPMFTMVCLSISAIGLSVYLLLCSCFFDVRTLSLISYDDSVVSPSTFNEVHVHFDFKGAPLSLSYITDILPILAYTGTTGLILEWEDMLPYGDKFDNTHPYKETQVFFILAKAEANNLTVIPLVPLYSDMDWVLKVKDYARLRQSFNDTRFMCPNATVSLDLISKMINRVMDFHRDAKYFHIGFRGPFPQESQDCSYECCKGRPLYDVIIDYLVTIVFHFHHLYPHMKLLMWDDLFRCIPVGSVKKLKGMGNYVIPVVQPLEEAGLFGENLESYTAFLSAIFPEVWISGSYRGSPEPHEFKLIPNLNQHLSLNSKQVDYVEKFQYMFDFPITSFVLTGPQRDSHYSLLNELTPASLPCITLSSYCLRHKVVGYKGLTTLFRELRCPPFHPTDEGAYSRCGFPGSQVYKVMMELDTLVRSDEYHQFEEWKTSRYMWYNLRHRYLPAQEIRNNLLVLDSIWKRLQQIVKELKSHLGDKLFHSSDAEEWLEQNILPLYQDVKRMRQTMSSMKRFWHWPRRQFNTSEDLIREFGN